MRSMKKIHNVQPAAESGGTGDASMKLDTSNELDPAAMIGRNRVKSKSFVTVNKKPAQTASTTKIRADKAQAKKPTVEVEIRTVTRDSNKSPNVSGGFKSAL